MRRSTRWLAMAASTVVLVACPADDEQAGGGETRGTTDDATTVGPTGTSGGETQTSVETSTDGGTTDTGAGSTDTGAGSTDTGAGSTDTGAGSTDTGADTAETGTDTGGDTGIDGTFAEVEQILGPTCRDACHQPGGLWAVFDLTGDLYAKIVGVTGPSQGPACNLVEPGDPDASYLFRKIAGTHLQGCAGSGSQMPVDPNNVTVPVPLPQEQIDLIEAWIVAGAPP